MWLGKYSLLLPNCQILKKKCSHLVTLVLVFRNNFYLFVEIPASAKMLWPTGKVDLVLFLDFFVFCREKILSKKGRKKEKA